MIFLHKLSKLSHLQNFKPLLKMLPVTKNFQHTPPMFSSSPPLLHSEDLSLPSGHIPINFILKDGTVVNALGRTGELALRLAQRYDVPMEGACEASLACVTCHCYVEESYTEMVGYQGLIDQHTWIVDFISNQSFIHLFCKILTYHE